MDLDLLRAVPNIAQDLNTIIMWAWVVALDMMAVAWWIAACNRPNPVTEPWRVAKDFSWGLFFFMLAVPIWIYEYYERFG